MAPLVLPAAQPAAQHIAPSSIEVATSATRSDWDDFVSAHPGGTADHLWSWQIVIRDVFRQGSLYLSALRDKRVVGILPLVRFRSRLFGRSIVSLPFLNYGGVLAADPDASAALLRRAREIASEFGASYVELRHQHRQFPDLPHRQHKLGLKRSLPSNAEELWSTIDRKIRNQVRKAQKDGLSSETGGIELVGDFYAVFARNMRDLGTPVYARALFHETLRAFPDHAHIHIVRLGPTPVAASVAIRHRDTVLVPWASSIREYQQHCPNMLLYWSMLEQAIRAGARVFDFGRSSPGSGPHRFKLQWGASETPLHWEYALLGNALTPDHGAQNPKFSTAVAAWRRLPLWLANRVGPAIVRNIP